MHRSYEKNGLLLFFFIFRSASSTIGQLPVYFRDDENAIFCQRTDARAPVHYYASFAYASFHLRSPHARTRVRPEREKKWTMTDHEDRAFFARVDESSRATHALKRNGFIRYNELLRTEFFRF